jgi:hypothetical protein
MTVPHETPGSGGYEKSDLRPKPIVVFGVILTLVTILAFVATYGMIRFLGWWEGPRLETPASPLATRTVPPEPRLQVDAPKELRVLQASEEGTLASYGWVSREAGIARIPIQRAMQLVLERGLPGTRTPAPPAVSAKGGAQ